MPAENLPEIQDVSSGDTWRAAPGTSDRRYDKSTVSLLFSSLRFSSLLFSFLLFSSGIWTAHFPEELGLSGRVRGNLPWGDTGEMDGQETKITPALHRCRRYGSNLLSLNADAPKPVGRRPPLALLSCKLRKTTRVIARVREFTLASASVSLAELHSVSAIRRASQEIVEEQRECRSGFACGDERFRWPHRSRDLFLNASQIRHR